MFLCIHFIFHRLLVTSSFASLPSSSLNGKNEDLSSAKFHPRDSSVSHLRVFSDGSLMPITTALEWEARRQKWLIFRSSVLSLSPCPSTLPYQQTLHSLYALDTITRNPTISWQIWLSIINSKKVYLGPVIIALAHSRMARISRPCPFSGLLFPALLSFITSVH